MADRIVLGMTGSTGQIYGIRLLELLRETPHESHLVISDAAKVNLVQESEYPVEAVLDLADETYEHGDISASLASGSFRTRGMIVAPCSMKTLAEIATGRAGNLLTRAADVTLKERRVLVVMPREKPFNRIHLQNMLDLTDAGGIVMPPFPSFYLPDQSLDDMITRTAARTLGLLDVELPIEEWTGLSS